MAGRYKTTGCFKFFIFLLIFVPIVYFGASYYHGVDGIGQIKDLLGMESAESNSNTDKESKKDDTFDIQANEKIEQLEKRIKDLEVELYRKTQEIEKLQSLRDNN